MLESRAAFLSPSVNFLSGRQGCRRCVRRVARRAPTTPTRFLASRRSVEAPGSPSVAIPPEEPEAVTSGADFSDVDWDPDQTSPQESDASDSDAAPQEEPSESAGGAASFRSRSCCAIGMFCCSRAAWNLKRCWKLCDMLRSLSLIILDSAQTWVVCRGRQAPPAAGRRNSCAMQTTVLYGSRCFKGSKRVLQSLGNSSKCCLMTFQSAALVSSAKTLSGPLAVERSWYWAWSRSTRASSSS